MKKTLHRGNVFGRTYSKSFKCLNNCYCIESKLRDEDEHALPSRWKKGSRDGQAHHFVEFAAELACSDVWEDGKILIDGCGRIVGIVVGPFQDGQRLIGPTLVLGIGVVTAAFEAPDFVQGRLRVVNVHIDEGVVSKDLVDVLSRTVIDRKTPTQQGKHEFLGDVSGRIGVFHHQAVFVTGKDRLVVRLPGAFGGNGDTPRDRASAAIVHKGGRRWCTRFCAVVVVLVVVIVDFGGDDEI